MNKVGLETQLLTAIRQSKIRLFPAIEEQRQKRPIKELFFKYLRILSPLGDIPFSIEHKYRFYLDGSVRPNTKTGTVYSELTTETVEKEKIWHSTLLPTSTFRKVIRILLRLPWLFVIIVSNRRILTSLDLIAMQVFVGYEAYKRFFIRHKKLIPIIISDISPTLHMQWSAAIGIKRDVFWWQVDYHTYVGFSAEDYMPYPCTYAAVLNQKGLETVLQKNPNAKVYALPQTLVKPFKTISSPPRLGVATNVAFMAKPDQIRHINSIRKNLGAEKVYFRLHPNSKLTKRELHEDWISIAHIDETIGQYCEKVDLVIVGNSAVQLKLLCAGIPIIHTHGLDDLGYDLYGYSVNGFCIGIKDFNQSISIKEVNRFYQYTELHERLKNYVNVRGKIPSLSVVQNLA